ncbi:MAG: aspartate--tRNA(Asn) ligase [Actinocatenispora sp.]
MRRVMSTELHGHVGETVQLAGWIHRRRVLKSVAFLILRDRTGLAQVVVGEPAARAELEKLPEETVVSVTGRVVANADAPGGVELAEPSWELLSEPAEPLPFEVYRPELRASLPTLLDNAPMGLRHPRMRAPFEIAAAAVAGFRATLDGHGFTEIHTPKLVGSATESGATVFGVDYFGRRAYLAQSPQFYKQMMVGVFERVYEVGPVFRAEPHDTARHLAEYTSLDVEFGFVTDHRDVMAMIREVFAGMLAAVVDRAGAVVELAGLTMPEVPAEIPVVHFTEALALIGAATGEDLSGEQDLAPAHERWLSDWAVREHGSEWLFVEGYPTAKRAFYTHPDPTRPGYSRGFDLLFRGLELISGAQRMHHYADYVAAITARGDSLAPYESYLRVFRHGMPPHGGFAIGLERFLARLTGASNVREVTLFPRDLHRLSP